MDFVPFDYQQSIINWIIEKPCCGLFLEMAMGKTVCTLTAINTLKYDYFEVDKVLVIAPLRVADTTWENEISKWNHTKHLKLSKIIGTEKERKMAIEADADLYVINRENVGWLVTNYMKKWKFDTMVIDESSSFKDSKSQRFRALRKIRPLLKRVVELTGTPAPNSLIELWPQLYLLDKGKRLEPTLGAFRTKYFVPGKMNGHVVYEWIPRPGAKEQIYKQIEDICISMKLEGNLSLTERIFENIEVELTSSAILKYKKLEKAMVLEQGDKAILAVNAGVLGNKLLQLANGAVYDENKDVIKIHDCKLNALENLVDSLEGQPVMILYCYKHDLSRMKQLYPEARELLKSKDQKDWNEGKIKILLAHPASVGHGLNLQFGGNTVIWFGLTWSLELYKQANARLYRPGQKENVTIYHLLAKGTNDEKVIKVLQNKNATQEDLLKALRLRIKEIKEESV